MKRGPFAITQTRFPGIRSNEQTEQIVRRIGICLKENKKEEMTVIVGLFLCKDQLTYHQIINICDIAKKFVQIKGTTTFRQIPQMVSVSAQRPVPRIAKDEKYKCHNTQP